MRLFVAVPVPAEVQGRLAHAGEALGPAGVSRVRAGNMHLTLMFLGEVGPGKPAELMSALSGVRFKAFGCEVKGAGAFPDPRHARVVWAGCASGGECESLAEKVRGALSPHLAGGESGGFIAHITIARIRARMDAEGFVRSHENESFGSFEVSEFLLVESVLGSGGPKYRTIGTFRASVD